MDQIPWSAKRLENAMKKLDDKMNILVANRQRWMEESDARGRHLDENIDKLVNDIHKLISQIPPEGVFGE